MEIVKTRSRKPPEKFIFPEIKRRKTIDFSTSAHSIKPNKSTVIRSKKAVLPNKGKRKLNEDEEEVVQDLEMTTFEDPEDEKEIEIPIKRKFIRQPKQYQRPSVCTLTGGPVPAQEARERWPHRYARRGGEDFLHVRAHYTSAKVNGVVFDINDCCLIKGDKGHSNYIGRITEFFETITKQQYITVKWFFQPAETVIQSEFSLVEAKRVFASESRSDIPLECVISKTKVVQASSKVKSCNYFYDMAYDDEFCTFQNLPAVNKQNAASSSSTISGEGSPKVVEEANVNAKGLSSAIDSEKSVMTMLDLYSGCGGLSTGLCMGANSSNVHLVTRWAVDYDEDACQSLRYNHPETEVRNEMAEDFLNLLEKWHSLCSKFGLLGADYHKLKKSAENYEREEEIDEDAETRPPYDDGDYELEKIVDICYGDPYDEKKPGLYYKVKWKGFSSDYDLWQIDSSLENCQESIEDFVREGYKNHILPLPGTVDVVCGGPPCQGVSGFNRHRNTANPMEDPKNYQLVVFMNIIEFLKPRFTLMENVVDILKFVGGTLGRYAIGRLVAMRYQVRLGLLTAGGFGLPQYRMRAFVWGAQTTEKLPQFPIPTHQAIQRGYPPKEFERNLVVGDENSLKDALCLKDAIYDLPPITTDAIEDEMEYGETRHPITEFQRRMRSPKQELMVSAYPQPKESVKPKLYDHRPLKLSDDDNIRVRMIPPEKGANYRDLSGVLVDKKTNTAYLDETKRVYIIKSGKPLVPNYAVKFVKGKSTKPFGRIWWDETVGTVVTRAEPHNQVILHPEQDRVLSIRENARLQGFPDWYRLFGIVKQRYTQIGNAVAVPVGRALGYTLRLAIEKTSDGGQVVALPPSFSEFATVRQFGLQYQRDKNRKRFRCHSGLQYQRNKNRKPFQWPN
ncbi:hypothetical protein MKX03_023979 [Papaver bracteatum]|nr:hypothetical protein MKX03_023979 [Papaver bracteatum]